MIDLFITLSAGAVAQARMAPDHGFELPVRPLVQSAPYHRQMLPDLRFDDSQDCLTFLERRMEGIDPLRADRLPAPWRSL